MQKLCRGMLLLLLLLLGESCKASGESTGHGGHSRSSLERRILPQCGIRLEHVQLEWRIVLEGRQVVLNVAKGQAQVQFIRC